MFWVVSLFFISIFLQQDVSCYFCSKRMSYPELSCLSEPEKRQLHQQLNVLQVTVSQLDDFVQNINTFEDSRAPLALAVGSALAESSSSLTQYSSMATLQEHSEWHILQATASQLDDIVQNINTFEDSCVPRVPAVDSSAQLVSSVTQNSSMTTTATMPMVLLCEDSKDCMGYVVESDNELSHVSSAQESLEKDYSTDHANDARVKRARTGHEEEEEDLNGNIPL